MRTVIGLAVALGLFAGSFALHIAGGRLEQGWLFALAVVLIYVFATGFPAVAWIAAGARWPARATAWIGTLAGVSLTVSAFWAANDRAFAWWQWPLAPVLVALSSGAIAGAWWWMQRRGAPSGASAAPAAQR